MAIHSIDAEDDQFAYRYDTQLLIERRTKIWMKTRFQITSPNISKETA